MRIKLSSFKYQQMFFVHFIVLEMSCMYFEFLSEAELYFHM